MWLEAIEAENDEGGKAALCKVGVLPREVAERSYGLFG